MGKSKGGKYFHAPRSRTKGKGPAEGDGEDGSEEEVVEQQRGVGEIRDAGDGARAFECSGGCGEHHADRRPVGVDCGVRTGAQRSNVGMLPPSDSEEEEDEGEVKPKSKPAKGAGGQPATAGTLPPNSDDEEEEDDDESESDDDEPLNEYLAGPSRQEQKRWVSRVQRSVCKPSTLG